MRELFTRITTRASYFIGFLIVFAILSGFFWHLFNPDSFNHAVNGFVNGVFMLIKYALALGIVFYGLKLMLFGNRKSGSKGGH